MEATTWIDVSRAALRANFDSVAKHAGVPVCAVVKANAYGHGLVEAARTFEHAKLGVTRIEEARALRNAGIDNAIFIMQPVLDPSEATALDCDITAASEEDIRILPETSHVQLKVDTGMGRLGVPPAEAVAAAQQIGQRLTGVWTHLADGAGSGGRAQIARFRAVLSALKHNGIAVPAHASNSAGLLAMEDARFDMVRVGTLLYGQDPPGATAPWKHAETFVWRARVVSVRQLAAGATIGYGSEFTAKEPMRVATIPIGYADGFMVEPRAREARARNVARALRRGPRSVYFNERPAPVLGRIAMQSITVSLSGLDDVGVGDIARIPARRLMVSPLIERVYS